MPDKPFEVCTDVDDAHYQVVSRHSSFAAAERAARKYENEKGVATWVEPDPDFHFDLEMTRAYNESL